LVQVENNRIIDIPRGLALLDNHII
jgi:hypothetical protein